MVSGLKGKRLFLSCPVFFFFLVYIYLSKTKRITTSDNTIGQLKLGETTGQQATQSSAIEPAIENPANIEQATKETTETAGLSTKSEYLQLLNGIERGLLDLESLYESGITSEMLEAESKAYKRWDDALNEIYGVLGEQLSSDEMNKLRKEQRRWIEFRDYTAETESLEFKGASMESLQYVSTQARLTKERCFELVQNHMQERANETNLPSSYKEETNSVFTLGSSKEEVIRVMGEPDETEEFGYVSSWRYEDSTIEFDENEEVTGWSNFSHILKVTVGSKQEGALPFAEGSSIEEVVKAMGTPDQVTHWGAIWHYQDSLVEFNGKTVIGWSDNSGILLVK
ncbi:DUF1311 domain-containing protein [Bacillus infantis]|uniref:DUF1311 domain-containing protein n=1 Tax=Bacillus infantis TaxID=324767 RepID=A0A5D4SAN0_9BACI|nr:lysozyme inhibitor LprI family protein [Bacillus infantis]TYS60673.1 DUF1311 domain-containing protein [Bacillus infantis]